LKQQYKSYQQSVDFINESIEKYPDIIQVQTIGKTWENRDIVLATISLDVKKGDSKPALLYTGTIHAREWIGNELAISFIEYLLNNYKSNPNIYNTLKNNTLYIVPCLNPDGYEYSRKHFSFWRKNRRDNKDGTFGVDLNRNFSIGYVKSTNTSSNVYGGPNPFSEPETKAIKEFVDTHTNITIALDYHSQGNVFFPAHKFNHEQELNGTDLNTMCANMNYEIHKLTNRKYGIHRGKPPTNLISVSGREYYYSKGIIAAVVEVGTRNIPDFLSNMSESVDENIPALLNTLGEAINYSHKAPKRVNNFLTKEFTSNEIDLSWEYLDKDENIYFEIYRNTHNKEACNYSNLLVTTSNLTFKDIQLSSSTVYYYYIRAINITTNIRSPFAPKLKVKTKLQIDEFAKTLFPIPCNIGYVSSKELENNLSHFGKNSLFIGINKSKGISYGVLEFDLSKIPNNAIIQDVQISLYPLNRVNAKIEKYGEWSISFVDTQSVSQISDYTQINDATIIETLGQTIPSERLTQGKWSHWKFNKIEKDILSSQLKNNKVLFKIQGPTKLPMGHNSQMMMFDIGYGKFGGGLHYRPNIDIKYTLPSNKIIIKANSTISIYKNEMIDEKLFCGFDNNNNKIYGLFSFDLSNLKNPKNTIVTSAYIQIKNNTISKTKEDIRYNIEFVDVLDNSYSSIQNRDRIEFIGYEVSQSDLRTNKISKFIFDNYSCRALENVNSNRQIAKFLIKPTASDLKNHLVSWCDINSKSNVQLVINYINKRNEAVNEVSNLKISVENKKVKLTWDNPEDDDFVGVYVVRNRFHIPSNHLDGDKMYAGNDNYTFDDFGNTKISKYYAIFTYDNVPNYSKSISIKHEDKK
jgi:hypothetical protein